MIKSGSVKYTKVLNRYRYNAAHCIGNLTIYMCITRFICLYFIFLFDYRTTYSINRYRIVRSERFFRLIRHSFISSVIEFYRSIIQNLTTSNRIVWTIIYIIQLPNNKKLNATYKKFPKPKTHRSSCEISYLINIL